MKEGMAIAKNGAINVDTFVRRPDLENYFPAILSGPIVKTKIEVENGPTVQDKDYYTPSVIQYFSGKGFYPFCYDSTHNKLKILVDETYAFPRYLIRPEDDESNEPVDEDNRDLCFSTSFTCYAPMFFAAIPFFFRDKIKGVEDLEFLFIPNNIFLDLEQYICDSQLVENYETNMRIVDNIASGTINEDYDSQAAVLVDRILSYVVNNRGTDVHIEYTGTKTRIRVRIDGDLKEYPFPQSLDKFAAAMINVIRIKCELNVAEHFKAQDGQMSFTCAFVDRNKRKVSSKYDIRVSVIPQVDGRLNAALRIQAKGEFKKLEELGYSPIVYRQMTRLCSEPHGIILVTGPTGSGKTTTLYSILNELNKIDVKIMTVEDPVEIRMEGLMQVKIDEKQGRTFPNTLKYFLRHDPDIILVGEIRDAETAQIAIGAANTGHLVLSTLHTNDATSAIKRLGSMNNIDPADFAFSLKGVAAQRLIKTFRPDITQMLQAILEGRKRGADIEALLERGRLVEVDLGTYLNEVVGESLFPEGVRIAWEGKTNIDGKEDGKSNVFEGRTAVTEVWKVGNKAADMIFDKNFSTLGLTRVAVEDDGMLPMVYSGVEKVIQGHTSPENLVKCVGLDAIRQYRELIMQLFKEGK